MPPFVETFVIVVILILLGLFVWEYRSKSRRDNELIEELRKERRDYVGLLNKVQQESHDRYLEVIDKLSKHDEGLSRLSHKVDKILSMVFSCENEGCQTKLKVIKYLENQEKKYPEN